jgi:hypothetical protein
MRIPMAWLRDNLRLRPGGLEVEARRYREALSAIEDLRPRSARIVRAAPGGGRHLRPDDNAWRCAAITREGFRCFRRPVKGSGFCWQHRAARQEKAT